ncbi:hypothetical protein Tco_0227743 [Tanacetum coccineum]
MLAPDRPRRLLVLSRESQGIKKSAGSQVFSGTTRGFGCLRCLLLVGRHRRLCDLGVPSSTTLEEEVVECGVPLRELDKQEVKQPEVDKLDLAELGVGKLELD